MESHVKVYLQCVCVCVCVCVCYKAVVSTDDKQHTK